MIAVYYECACCGAFHSARWDGDCRDNGARYFSPDDLDQKHPEGWNLIEMDEVDEWRTRNGM